MGNLADVFKALADETRVKMLALLLRRGELCVCDFVEALEVTQSKASRHLRRLLHAGLARDRRDGAWVYYRLGPDAEGAKVLKALRPLLASVDLSEEERRLDVWEKAKFASIPCHVTRATTPEKRGRR